MIESKPSKNLFAVEWAMIAYLVLTTLVIVFCYTKVQNPEAMLWGRVRILFTTAALYAVYRMVPCRLTRLARVVVQVALLSWWYPDTYELNRMFPNLDHIFATWEQQLFGCQPALLFSQLPFSFGGVGGGIFSELMDLGYASYYPMIAVVIIYYFFRRYDEFLRASFVVMASFFLFYVIFVFLPVVGPTFYYQAVGLDTIMQGVFPNVGDYFNHHTECLPSPGYTDGFFYHLVENAKAAGERPTAAFPFQPRRHQHHPDVPGLACPRQASAFRPSAFLCAAVLLYGVYPGPLCHRCLGRTGHGCHLLPAVLDDEGDEGIGPASLTEPCPWAATVIRPFVGLADEKREGPPAPCRKSLSLFVYLRRRRDYSFTYSEKSVRCMSPLRVSVSCIAKAAGRLWCV